MTTTPWPPCDSNGCIQTRTVDDRVEIRDTGNPDATLLVPVEAWEKFLAAVRAEALKVVARALLEQAQAYDAKWCHKPVTVGAHLDWDRGFVRGMQAAAHDVPNSIDRPSVLTEFRPVDTEETKT